MLSCCSSHSHRLDLISHQSVPMDITGQPAFNGHTPTLPTHPPDHGSNALLKATHKYKVDTCHCPSLTLAIMALNAHMCHAQPPTSVCITLPFVRAVRLGGSFLAVAGTMTKLQGIFLCTNISNRRTVTRKGRTLGLLVVADVQVPFPAQCSHFLNLALPA